MWGKLLEKRQTPVVIDGSHIIFHYLSKGSLIIKPQKKYVHCRKSSSTLGDNNMSIKKEANMMQKSIVKITIFFITLFLVVPLLMNISSFSFDHSTFSSVFFDSKIIVNGDTDLENQAITNGWLGEGTKNNPYIIGNYSYDYVDNPTSIYNTTKSILISNININNSEKPCIFLSNAKNINGGIHLAPKNE